MNRLTMILAAAAIGLSTAAAHAADLPQMQMPVAMPAYEPVAAAPMPDLVRVPVTVWSGIYGGVNGGYAFGGENLLRIRANGAFLGNVGRKMPEGFVGGAQLGYNMQLGSFVVGVEADVQKSYLRNRGSADFDGTAVATRNDIDWYGTLRPRVGMAFGPTLVYGTGGLVLAGVRAGFDVNGISAARENKTRFGWTVGGGVEHAFTDTLSMKVEYGYVQLGQRTLHGTVDGVDYSSRSRADFHTVRTGLNYRF